MRLPVAVLAALLLLSLGVGAVSAGGWQTETVAPVGEFGLWTSIALDGSDNPHISYLDQLNNTLKYAWRDSSGWHIEAVGVAGSLHDPGDLSLALDGADRPRISYLENGIRDVKYAWRDGSGWHIETVDAEAFSAHSTDLALDGAGNPRICYVVGAETIASNCALKYAWRDGSGWHTETVDSGRYPLRFSSLDLDSAGNPRISYSGASAYNADLMYARRDTTGWHTETAVSEELAEYTSLRLTGAGNPCISYWSGGLKYAWRDSSGWHSEMVVAGTYAGMWSSLALTSGGSPRISYEQDETLLGYAWRDGSGWHTETVDSDGVFGCTSLAIDNNDSPRFSYFCLRYDQPTTGVVKYAWQVLKPDFEATPLVGTAPLMVQFTDQTTGGQPLSWHWDFGDGTTSSLTNPVHIYAARGRYDVTLTVTNGVSGSRSATRNEYVLVLEPVIANFTASPRTGYAPLTVHFTDTSTGNPTGWTWYLDNGGASSTVQNPVYTYAAPGMHRISLEVSKTGGTNATTKYNYIHILPLTGPFTIQAEDYDDGGEGVAYHDTTASNEGGVYRGDGVDIEAFGREYVISHIRDGEWTQYTIPSAAAVDHDYNLTLRVSTRTTGEQVSVRVDGFKDEVVVDLPDTGSLTDYVDVSTTLRLHPGTNTVRFTFNGDYTNVDSFVLDPGDIDPLQPVPGAPNAPTDLHADGRYDDVNGNGRADFADVVLYFNQLSWIAANEPLAAFDYNRNGRIDFADVVWLFNNL